MSKDILALMKQGNLAQKEPATANYAEQRKRSRQNTNIVRDAAMSFRRIRRETPLCRQLTDIRWDK